MKIPTMRYREIEIFVYGLINVLGLAESASILTLSPAPFRSRFSFNEAIMKSLHEAGHKITFINPFPSKNQANYTIIDPSVETSIFTGRVALWQFTNLSTMSLLEEHESMFERYCHDVMKLKIIQEILNSNEKLYDVLFIDIVSPIVQCYFPIAEKLDVPIIGMVASRTWKLADFAIGLPNNPAVMPFEFAPVSGPVMTFGERMETVWAHLLINYRSQFITRGKLDRFYEKYYPNLNKPWKKKVSAVFYNNHVSLFPRVSIPNTFDIGGIHTKRGKSLPQDLKTFIEEAKSGVILFTFGSTLNASTLPVVLRSAFVDAFAAIPQRVIWKYEGKIENLSDNVLLANWVPQFDILNHKNVKAFISHCGLNGIYEAIHTGTPLITSPVYVEQHANAALLEKLGVGLRLDLKTVNTAKVLNALNAIINDTRYHERMQELSRVFKDRPMSPQQSVVYWTEYVIRHNGAFHLRAVGSEMPLYQYFLLDIILLGVIAMAIILGLVVCAFKKCSAALKNRYRTPIGDKKKIH